jgi:hypothetical protein
MGTTECTECTECTEKDWVVGKKFNAKAQRDAEAGVVKRVELVLCHWGWKSENGEVIDFEP